MPDDSGEKLNSYYFPLSFTKWHYQLGWSKPLNLTSDDGIIKVLDYASQGQLQVLYESLRKVAIWKIDHPNAQINPQNVSKALGSHHQPISKL